MRLTIMCAVALGLTAHAAGAQTAPETPPTTPAAEQQPAAAATTALIAPATAAPPAPPPPPVVTLPTAGDGAALIGLLQSVCAPAVVGGNLDALAKASGLKKNRDGAWVGVFGAKPFSVTVFPAGSNPNACNLSIDHVQGGAQPLVDGLIAWAYLHQPALQLYRNDEVVADDFKRRTISWEYLAPDGGSVGLVFVGLKKPDGSAVSKVGDRSTLIFQVNKPG